jgi:hypothetical protein
MWKWWTRVLRDHVQGDTARVSAEVTWLWTAEEFLRSSLNVYDLPNQAAVAKARLLLEKALTPEQRRDLLARRCFYVKGKRFTYCIREGHAANVDALDSTGGVISRFCAHPVGRLPVYDVMLAQKLWIETDENMFLKKATLYPLQH